VFLNLQLCGFCDFDGFLEHVMLHISQIKAHVGVVAEV
jgi:hypothetical protein